MTKQMTNLSPALQNYIVSQYGAAYSWNFSGGHEPAVQKVLVTLPSVPEQEVRQFIDRAYARTPLWYVTL